MLTGVSSSTPRLKTEPSRSAHLIAGKLVHRVEPVYPRSLAGDVDPNVELSAKVTRQGTVEDVKVLRGNPALAHAAAEAVRRWRYQPYLLDGQPVDVETTISIRFNTRK